MRFSNTLLLLFSACCLLSLAQAGYDEEQARSYAYASALSHCSPDSIKSWNCGVNCDKLPGYKYFYAEVFNVSSLEAFSFALIYNPSEKKFITTYRGTVGNVQLFLEILEGNSVPYSLSNIPGAVADEYFYSHYVKYLRPIVVPQLQAAIKAFPDYEFVFTGHSLGAALTTLNAFDLISQGIIPKEKVIMYNYGSPRVGNAILAQAIQAAIPVIFRVTHWADLVPHVPPCMTDKNGVCKMSKSDNAPPLNWPAYHLTPEVFYDAGNTKHTICKGGEDPTCADQFTLVHTSMTFHDHYLNVSIGNCGSSKSEHGHVRRGHNKIEY
jgi:hypothetical protein